MKEIVKSNRNLYIPSKFAKDNLFYIQEVGQTTSLEKHTNSRNGINSFLFFIILDGEGFLKYNQKQFSLSKGNIVYIDCSKPFSHTSDNWTIKWIHFFGSSSKEIFEKYLSRDGLSAFKSKQFSKYNELLDKIFSISNTQDYIKDMKINECISSLLTLAMSETVYGEEISSIKYDIESIRKYIDNNFTKELYLDDLATKFFINKFYLTRLFKKTYGKTINSYISEKRVTKAKELLRYSDLGIDEISLKCGINDANYFSRLFKKVEGVSPKEYRKIW